MKRFPRLIALAAALTLGAAAVPALAGTASSTFQVTANVTTNCQITNTSGIAFSYDPIVANATTAATASGTVSALCTKGDVVTVALDQGLNAASGSTCVAPARQMVSSGGSKLAYSLYQNSSDSTVWGCDTTNEYSYTSASGLTAQSLSVYGVAPAGQDIPSGSYADTVTVTVTF